MVLWDLSHLLLYLTVSLMLASSSLKLLASNLLFIIALFLNRLLPRLKLLHLKIPSVKKEKNKESRTWKFWYRHSSKWLPMRSLTSSMLWDLVLQQILKIKLLRKLKVTRVVILGIKSLKSMIVFQDSWTKFLSSTLALSRLLTFTSRLLVYSK